MPALVRFVLSTLFSFSSKVAAVSGADLGREEALLWLCSSEEEGRCFCRREDADQAGRVRTLFQGGRSPDLNRGNAVQVEEGRRSALGVRTLSSSEEEDADLKAIDRSSLGEGRSEQIIADPVLYVADLEV